MSLISPATSRFFSKHGWKVLLILILAIAAFMRFYRLDVLPPGLHPDEAANGLNVFGILEHHDIRPFYDSNGGREGLFFFLQSIGVAIFGNTIFALRAAPALIGTLAVAAVYLWANSWFGRRVGLVAAALMAFTPWAVTLSRDGFRASMVALLVPLVLWLFTKSIQTKRMAWFIAAGVALAAGFYTYIAFRLFPVALVLIAGYLALFRKRSLKQWLSPLAISLVAAAIVLVPLGWYASAHPDQVFGRSGGDSFTNPALNHGHPVQTLLDTSLKTALMFNIYGDENYRHNFSGQPAFNLFVGVMFLLGLLFCLTRLTKLRYFALLAVFLSMLLPEILTAESIPHFLRAIGALPAAVVLAAIGINYMLQRWNAVFPINSAARVSGTVAIVILLLLSAYQGYTQYFVAWAHSQDTYDAYSEDSVALAKYLNSSHFQGKRYVVSGEYQMMTVEYLTHNHSQYTRTEVSGVDAIPLAPEQAKEFSVFEHDRETVFKRLRLKFPNGHISPHYSDFSGNELFAVFTVPAQ